jgi:molecular chaperone HtpG
MMMHEYDKAEFKSITDDATNEISKEEQEKIESTTADNKRLLDNIKESLKEEIDDVVISSKLVDSPLCLSTKDGLSLEMEKTLNEQPGAEENVKAQKILELNPNHALFEAFTKIQNDDELVKNYASVLYEEAMLLEGREITDKKAFVDKVNDLFIKAMK